MTRSLFAAALAGALIAVGGAPLEFSFLTWLAPCCLLFAIEPLDGEVTSSRAALWMGLTTGFTGNLISMYWIVGLLDQFAGFPTALSVLVGSLLWFGQAISYGLATWLAAVFMRRGLPGWIALPAALTVAASLTPSIFPWRYGLSQLPFLEYAQVAELGGLPLLDWLVATIGCGLLAGLRARSRAAQLLALAAMVLPPLFGLARLPSVRAARAAAPILRVGVTQPNVSIKDKHDPARFLDQLHLLQDQTRSLEEEGAQLVIWPETAYRFPILRGTTRDRVGPLALLNRGAHGPLIVGVLTTAGRAQSFVASDGLGRRLTSFRMAQGQRFNSAIAVDREGRIVGTADKVNPLAFGEYTPLWELIPWLQVFPRGISPGAGPQQLTIAGARIGVLNCYEDLLYEHVRAQARYRPELWVNVTNNAWFGDTTAPLLHHMNARLRAIETRRDLVRSVNTGVSGHTASTGEDLARTGQFVRARFVADARLLSGVTLYVWAGDWVTPSLMGGLFGFGLFCWRTRRIPERRPRARTSPHRPIHKRAEHEEE